MAITVTSANTNNINYGSRAVVRTSGGIPYVVLIDESQGNGVVEVWKGNATTPTSFTEQDTGNRPNVSGTETVRGISCAIDSSDVIHIAYYDTSNARVYYSTFNTATDAYATIDEQAAGSGVSTDYWIDIAVDAENIPHIVYVRAQKNMGTDYHTIKYTHRNGGSWLSSEIQVEGYSNEKFCYRPSIIINQDQRPHIAYVNGTDSDLGVARGNQTYATSFSLHDPDTAVLTTTDNTPIIITDDENADYVVYIDSTNDLNYVKRPDSSGWTSWDSVTTLDSTNNWATPSAMCVGLDIYTIAEDTGDNDIYYIKNTGTRTSLQTGTYSLPRFIGGTWTSFDSTGENMGVTGAREELDYVYVDSTNIAWDKVDIGGNKVTAYAGSSGSGTSHSFSYTNPAGNSNTMLVVSVQVFDSNTTNRPVTGITYNSVSMTKINHSDAGAGTSERAELWYLVAPATGSNTLAVSMTGSVGAILVGAISLKDVKQTGIPDNSNTNTGSSSTKISITLTPTATETVVIDSSAPEPNLSTSLFMPGQVEYHQQEPQTYQTGLGSFSHRTTASQVTYEYNLNYGARWASAIASFEIDEGGAPAASFIPKMVIY